MLAEGHVMEQIALIIMAIGIYYFIRQGDQGKRYYMRKIAGIDALDEAIERAAEMGKGVHFAVGDRADIKGSFASQVVAGLEILGHIAQRCAALKTRLIVSLGGRSGTGGELVPLCREIVRDAYEKEGGEYTEDIVRFLAGERAGFESGMQGILRRENIATNILTGPWAGSVVSPTGVSLAMGIVCITGTARTYWMAVLTCFSDYFLIGDELYAAGAVLSGDVPTLASLKVSDYVKLAMLAILIIGFFFKLFGSNLIADIFAI